MTPAPSPLKSETARVNGALSNGPVTAEGKAVSSQNALRHGLCSQKVVLPGEDQAAYDQLREDYLKRLRPEGPAETELVETIAASSWRLKRIIRLETSLFADENADPLKSIGLLIRYENQLNRTYTLAMQRLELLQQNRVAAARAAKSGTVRNEPTPISRSISEKELHRAIAEAMALPAGAESFNPALKHPGAGR